MAVAPARATEPPIGRQAMGRAYKKFSLKL
jgi:hypothetical protein